MSAMSLEDEPLNIVIDSGQLVISIGVNVLLSAIKHELDDNLNITDPDEFLDAIVEALDTEDHDGSTSVHRVLEEAARQAVEAGCEGIEFKEIK